MLTLTTQFGNMLAIGLRFKYLTIMRKKNHFIKAAFYMFAFLLLQISVSAQSSIKGKVTDAAMVPAAYGITVTPPATYYTQPAVAYVGTSTEKLGKIALQKWVSLFFTGLEAWFDWRRTGLPVIVPGVDNLNNNRVPVRFIYPLSEQALNKANRDAAVARQGVDDINTLIWIAK